MKGLKKLLTGILAATMIMGCTLTAAAADITINQNTEGLSGDAIAEARENQSYNYYQIMKADISDSVTKNEKGQITGGSVAYYVDSEDKATALQGTGLFKYSKSDDSHYYITLVDETTSGEAVAAALKTMVDANTTLFPKSDNIGMESDGSTTISVPGDGYYLITSTLGANMVVQTLGSNVVINEKNAYPTIDKKQNDKEAANYANEDVNVKVGDTIYYEITVNVPAGTGDVIKVTDTLSNGLEFTGNITITGYGADTATTVNGKSFTVELPKNTGEATTSVITFAAIVTKDAIVDTGKKNEVKLEYGNYKQEDTVFYKTYRTGAFKYDGANANALAGVKFTLKEGETEFKVSMKDGYYYPDAAGSAEVVTNADGYIIIRGLDSEKTYTLYETETLTGYNLPAEAERTKLLTLVEDATTADGTLVSPEVVKTEGRIVPGDQTFTELALIENNSGTVLPSTGGIGTTIFYIVGAVLIIAGVAYFILKRKADAE